MNSLRKVFGFLLAGLMLAAFASPGMAQTKIYSLTMSYQGITAMPGPNGTTTTAPTYRALYRNETPNGNSTINSVILAAPAGMTIANAKVEPALVTNNTTIAGKGTNSISVAYVVGIKAGGSTGYVDVQVSGSPTTCGPWSPQAFAGNAFSQPFQLQTQLSTLSLGTCQVNLVMAPPSVNQSSTLFSMTGTLTNTSGWPIGSLTLAAPTTIGLTIPSLPTLTLPGGTTASVAWCLTPGGAICVNGIAPALAPGAQLKVNLTVNVAATCTTTLTGNWSATAYAGATQNGAAFPTDAASQRATAINASPCTVNVSPSPALNGIAGTALPPVTVTVSGGAGSGSASVTASGCTLTAGSTTTLATPATFSNLVVSSASTSCTLNFAVPGYTATSYGPFTVFATGPVACQPTVPYSINASVFASGSATTDINTPGYWLIQRGAYNKDGGPCQEIGITANNSIVGSGTGQSVTLNWDTGLQPGAAFLYTITWNPEYVDMTTGGTGLPSLKTSVNWTGSPYATPVAGRACIAWNPTKVAGAPVPLHYLPFPYGTLAANVTSAGATTIQVTHPSAAITPNTTVNAIPPVPFAINIDSERMTVTHISGPTWTVSRGVGNTTAAGHCAVGNWSGTACVGTTPTSRNVMSNPLPVADDGYQQRVCIAEEGWSIVPAGAPNCPVKPAIGGATVPTSCALVTTTIYDIGDGSVGRGAF